MGDSHGLTGRGQHGKGCGSGVTGGAAPPGTDRTSRAHTMSYVDFVTPAVDYAKIAATQDEAKEYDQVRISRRHPANATPFLSGCRAAPQKGRLGLGLEAKGHLWRAQPSLYPVVGVAPSVVACARSASARAGMPPAVRQHSLADEPYGAANMPPACPRRTCVPLGAVARACPSVNLSRRKAPP